MNERRYVRSYHRAFLGELTIYSFGRDLRPWRPVPARGIVWVAAVEACSFLALRVLGVRLPLFSMSWALFYLFVPLGLGYLCTVSRIEGRRLHVALGAWARYALAGRETVGGCRRARPPASLRSPRVNLLPEVYAPRRSRARYLVALLPLMALVTLLYAVTGTYSARRAPYHAAQRAATVVRSATPAPPAAVSSPIPVTPRLPARPALGVPPRHAPARSTAPAHRVNLRVASRLPPPTPPRYAPARVGPPVPRAILARPVVVPAHTPRRSAAPARPSCYPGQLGC